MKVKYFLLVGISCGVILAITQYDPFESKTKTCTDNWHITGYYIPVESDFLGEYTTIEIDTVSKKYKTQFIDQVKIEGWGKTNSGNYLGWYDNKFHLNQIPLDYFGDELVDGIVAVDPKIIKLKSKISIPSLGEPWNKKILIATDIGSSIKGKHIDVFTGIGENAKNETLQITGHGNRVCLII